MNVKLLQMTAVSLFLFSFSSCASTSSTNSVYKQDIAELEADYVQGKISKDEYDDRKRDMKYTDSKKTSTWLNVLWND